MKDNLKNRFQEENFDLEPLEGHEHRFETKLMFAEKAKKKNRRPTFYYLLAAACFLGVIITVVLLQTQKEIEIAEEIQVEKQNELRLADFSYGAATKEKYYKNEIEKRQDYNTDDPSLQPLLERLNRLEKEHQSLEKRLADNIRNENLINAVLNNYKLRLEVLEKLQKIIRFKNKTKDNSHEKNSNTKG